MSEEKKFFPSFKIRSYSLEQNWFIEWRDEYGTRKRKYGTINRHSTYEARMKAAEALKKELEEETIPKTLLRDKMKTYLEERKRVWRKKTYQGIKSKIKVFLEAHGAIRITPETTKAFFKDLELKRNPTTYNNYLIHLNAMFKRIGEPQLTEGLQKLRENRKPARFFQPHQIGRLKKAIQEKDPELWLFVQFIYYCFIRPGELRWLRVGDIMLDEGQIIVRAEISKNKRSQYVAIPDAFKPVLEPLKQYPANHYVFPSPRDISKPVGINSMYRRHYVILKEQGFNKDYKLYSWKHTGAVMFVKAGGNLKELQIQLRHHSLDQVNEYLRQMGVNDLKLLSKMFPQL